MAFVHLHHGHVCRRSWGPLLLALVPTSLRFHRLASQSYRSSLMTDTQPAPPFNGGTDPLFGVIEGLIFRHVLGIIGGVLVHSGLVSTADAGAFEKSGFGIIMGASAMALSWYQKKEQAKVVDFLKRIGTKVPAILLAAALLPLLAAVGAHAQTKKPPNPLTLPDPLHLLQPSAPANTGDATANPSAQDLWQKIVTAALPDLVYAKALADSAKTAGGDIRSECWGALIAAN